MRKRLSLKVRLMITTSLLLVVMSILFTVFSILNAYVNLIKPFEKMYLEQQGGVYTQEIMDAVQEDTMIIVDGNDFFIANVIFMIAAIAVGCALTYLIARFSLKPLRIWSKEMSDIDQNQLSRRIQNSNTGDELDTLADAFNQLLDRLQKAFDREKRFSAAAAHELKTPLTVVKTNIEVLQMDEESEVEDYKETIEVISKQNDRMIQLVRDLGLLSSSNIQNQRDVIDMDAVIDEIEKDLKDAFLSKAITFECNRIGFRMNGNAVLMKHALSNLIENAIKYNTKNGEISVSQVVMENAYRISVSDTGIGIRQEDIPYIFEPFYRADKSRNRSEGGSGLGLAITKEIIESHKGTIEYQSREPQGSIFTISLPDGSSAAAEG